ncbi:MAG: phosphate ABC transporter substrate-binding protein PstS family protein [Marinospirillum sp.]|uniref:PstS family phosphate ABC transporter substrate-binding protein n=1 Tax=Marinospirillum sp. TaxID=2183934 RepID=UPI0019DD6405|nr:phosphate ABC transporter substrate-binding protein PstS family protein [Marinospirillum sp.]MBE0507142.1 phosphate ABC transporter substrate-binding protein PstS family protein [Marinospirillum sp.]
MPFRFFYVLLFACLPLQAADVRGLPDYQRISGISGNLSTVGSDTLANLMTLWAEEFRHFYPGIHIQVQASGSSTAPPALAEGTANLGAMSRPMRDSEVQAFEMRHGYPPTAIPVAIDALAVYVHKDNPLTGLTLSQLDAIFSSTRHCGANQPVNHWGDLGLTGSWSNRPIQLYGRNSVSGTYGYFKSVALCGGDFRNNVNEQPGSASVVQAISTSLNAIGYSGIGYRTSSVRAIALARSADQPYIEATPEQTSRGDFPLSRFLYIYVNKRPNQPLPPLEREFIRMVLSQQGQGVVLRDGYIPLAPWRVEQLHQLLGL